jgi:hypothetical protein
MRKHQALSQVSGKSREASGVPSSGVHVGGTRFGPLFEIYVLSFVQHDFCIADNRHDNVIAAY